MGDGERRLKMQVRLHYETKDEKKKVIIDRMTVKVARKYYKIRFKNDDNVNFVYLTSMGEWREYCHTVLKDTRKQS